jgi:hypothetical protein
MPMQKIVRCGWCPMHLANDWMVIALHFAEDHGLKDGSRSVRYDIQGDDWDVAELAAEGTATSQDRQVRP